MIQNFTSLFFIVLLSAASISSTVAWPTDEGDRSACEQTFTSYGFGYIKVKHTTDGTSFYIISENIITHCCGDVAQMNRLVLSLNNEGSMFITTWLQGPLEEYVLVPSLSKCLKTEAEAEKVRLKKIELFKKLGNKVYEAKMDLPLEGGCK